MATNSKIALVTGGSRGLGKNAALQLAQKGIDVILTYRTNKQEAEAVVATIQQNGQKAAALQLDVADTKSFDGFIQQLTTILKKDFGTDRFNFLINNAGIDGTSPVTSTSEELFDSLFNVHLKGTYFLTQKALPILADGGRIINFSSGWRALQYPATVPMHL
jgi:NAD(P)-dependent dehydrogenase (short-subunit alcohol dehydrogenase family)